MRNLFLAIIFLASIATACEKNNEMPEANTTVDLKFYAIQACGQITDMTYPDTPQSWFVRVKDLLEEDGIVLEESNLNYEVQEHFGFCGNCERTGDVLAVSATEEFEQALRDFGFTD